MIDPEKPISIRVLTDGLSLRLNNEMFQELTAIHRNSPTADPDMKALRRFLRLVERAQAATADHRPMPDKYAMVGRAMREGEDAPDTDV